MPDKKQSTDHMNPVEGTSFAGKPVDALISAPLQDGTTGPLKGSQVPPMKQPKNLG